jgi:hypothetical protein
VALGQVVLPLSESLWSEIFVRFTNALPLWLLNLQFKNSTWSADENLLVPPSSFLIRRVAVSASMASTLP